MHTVEIRGALRTVVHKRGARQTRAAGKTPGVLYGKDEKSMSISLDSKEFDAVLRKHGGGTFLLDLKLEGQEDRELKAIIKELQRDPVTSRVLHVDLLHVSLTQMIHVNVPIHLTGTAAGVKEGGVLEQHCREIEVQCQVARIPENCKIDITELVIGQSVHVEDISLPEGVTVLTPPDRVVAIVAAKAIAVEPTEVAEDAAEGEEVPEDEAKAAATEEGPKTEETQGKS